MDYSKYKNQIEKFKKRIRIKKIEIVDLALLPLNELEHELERVILKIFINSFSIEFIPPLVAHSPLLLFNNHYKTLSSSRKNKNPYGITTETKTGCLYFYS